MSEFQSLEAILERLASLPLRIGTLDVEMLSRPSLAGGLRCSSVVRMRGLGVEGLGEDVTFQAGDLLRAPPPRRVWAGIATLGDLWAKLDAEDLFLRPPEFSVVRNYRRWALEAAALDLALRQGELSFPDLVGAPLRPVRFVVSPPQRESSRFAAARLKLDAAEIEPGHAVDIVDFKLGGDRPLAERVRAFYPEAFFEDPPLSLDDTKVSWDIPIRSADDVRSLASRPAAINVKPARLGSLRALFQLYDECAKEGIAVYGGGQHELGPGRRQIQLLASLFHPNAPNDVAPGGYNNAGAAAGVLPTSPLVMTRQPGFG
jgi:hypothetical protein